MNGIQHGLAPRRSSRLATVAKVAVGGGAPIVIQSMTNTDTEDVFGTAMQVAQLARAGSELVRITVNTREAAAAVPKIRERLAQMNVDVPLIGDFHFNGHKLLAEHPACAEALAKLRINPGNVGKGARRDGPGCCPNPGAGSSGPSHRGHGQPFPPTGEPLRRLPAGLARKGGRSKPADPDHLTRRRRPVAGF